MALFGLAACSEGAQAGIIEVGSVAGCAPPKGYNK